MARFDVERARVVELREQATDLRKQADRRAEVTAMLLAQLRAHEGTDFVPFEPRRDAMAVASAGSSTSLTAASESRSWISRRLSPLICYPAGVSIKSRPPCATRDNLIDVGWPWHPRSISTTTFRLPTTTPSKSVIDYRVPAEEFSALAEFDGTVIVERPAGEVSASRHVAAR
ncbi:MAG: hypothetical protein H0X18_06825 [Geodermatophilaceae bacterium]|nr:hypothetical protein [Geodermatophilaceae bacterium]